MRHHFPLVLTHRRYVWTTRIWEVSDVICLSVPSQEGRYGVVVASKPLHPASLALASLQHPNNQMTHGETQFWHDIPHALCISYCADNVFSAGPTESFQTIRTISTNSLRKTLQEQFGGFQSLSRPALALCNIHVKTMS